jgi:superfamily II DNA or RNA helicase
MRRRLKRYRRNPGNRLYKLLLQFNQTIKSSIDEGHVTVRIGNSYLEVETDPVFKHNSKKPLPPKYLYRINIISGEAPFRPELRDGVYVQSISQADLAKKEEVFSAFRVLFVGNFYLHPNLGIPFNLTRPQLEALEAFKKSIRLKRDKGALVLPTGVGKTALVAHIVKWWKPQNILFLAHQKEILKGAIAQFRKFNPQITVVGALFSVTKDEKREDPLLRTRTKALSEAVVFASRQSMVRRIRDQKPEMARRLSPSRFDLVIVDEFHHINCSEYSEIVEHFDDAKYLLGMSATPFRGDGKDPVELLEGNIIYRMNLAEAILEGYLVWPEYFLINDLTDYEAFLADLEEKISPRVAQTLPNPAREDMIIEQFKLHLTFKNDKFAKTLAFCRTQDHADRMAERFNEAGIRAEALTTRHNKDRTPRLKRFVEGTTDVLFTVDLFNEGVDVPEIEAVMFLAGSKSPVKNIQQLGRGLRLTLGKRIVKVLDFIGNYESLDQIINLGIIVPGATREREKPTEPQPKKEAKLIDIVKVHIDEEVKELIRRASRLQRAKVRRTHDWDDIYWQLAEYVGKVPEGLDRVANELEIQQLRHRLEAKDKKVSYLETFSGALNISIFSSNELRVGSQYYDDECRHPDCPRHDYERDLCLIHFTAAVKQIRRGSAKVEDLVNRGLWKGGAPTESLRGLSEKIRSQITRQRKYPKKVRQAIRMLDEDPNMSVPDVATRLQIPLNTLIGYLGQEEIARKTPRRRKRKPKQPEQVVLPPVTKAPIDVLFDDLVGLGVFSAKVVPGIKALHEDPNADTDDVANQVGLPRNSLLGFYRTFSEYLRKADAIHRMVTVKGMELDDAVFKSKISSKRAVPALLKYLEARQRRYYRYLR